MKRTLSLSLALLALAGCSRVDYVEIEPSQVLLRRRGEGLQLRAKPMNRNGQYFPREPVSWSADDPKVAKIDRDGQLTAVGPGHAVVTAKAGGRTSTVDVEVRTVETVRVTPASVTLKVDDGAFRPEVEPLDSKGHELKDRTIEMKAADENVADVDGEQIWPVGPGHTVVTVRADDRSGSIEVTVTGTGKGTKKGKRRQ